MRSNILKCAIKADPNKLKFVPKITPQKFTNSSFFLAPKSAIIQPPKHHSALMLPKPRDSNAKWHSKEKTKEHKTK